MVKNQKKPKTMTVHCHKCGRKWESEFEVVDRVACPVCGIHGGITTTNSKTIKIEKTRTVIVPVD